MGRNRTGLGLIGFALVAMGIAGCGGPKPGSAAFVTEAKATCHLVQEAYFTNPVRFESVPPEQFRKVGDEWKVGGYLDSNEQTYTFICTFDDDGKILYFNSTVYDG